MEKLNQISTDVSLPTTSGTVEVEDSSISRRPAKPSRGNASLKDIKDIQGLHQHLPVSAKDSVISSDPVYVNGHVANAYLASSKASSGSSRQERLELAQVDSAYGSENEQPYCSVPISESSFPENRRAKETIKLNSYNININSNRFPDAKGYLEKAVVEDMNINQRTFPENDQETDYDDGHYTTIKRIDNRENEIKSRRRSNESTNTIVSRNTTLSNVFKTRADKGQKRSSYIEAINSTDQSYANLDSLNTTMIQVSSLVHKDSLEEEQKNKKKNKMLRRRSSDFASRKPPNALASKSETKSRRRSCEVETSKSKLKLPRRLSVDSIGGGDRSDEKQVFFTIMLSIIFEIAGSVSSRATVLQNDATWYNSSKHNK